MTDTVLSIKNLSIRYINSNECVVKNFDFELHEGEILCLRGRSGIGKSTIMAAIMGMLPYHDAIAEEGQIIFEGKDLLKCSESELKKVRWRKIAIVPQSSMNSFNPIYTIRKSIYEMLQLGNKSLSNSEMRVRAEELMDMVCLDRSVLNYYPHEMSGGMKQRAAIAMAMVYSPKLLILDEATTGLDIKVQADVLGTILRIQKNSKMSILFTSHDADLGNKFCHRRVEMI